SGGEHRSARHENGEPGQPPANGCEGPVPAVGRREGENEREEFPEHWTGRLPGPGKYAHGEPHGGGAPAARSGVRGHGPGGIGEAGEQGGFQEVSQECTGRWREEHVRQRGHEVVFVHLETAWM